MKEQPAFNLDNPPMRLGASEMAALLGVGRSWFYRQARNGEFDCFKLKPAIGPKSYSGVLVARYFKGEPLYVATFGQDSHRRTGGPITGSGTRARSRSSGSQAMSHDQQR